MKVKVNFIKRHYLRFKGRARSGAATLEADTGFYPEFPSEPRLLDSSTISAVGDIQRIDSEPTKIDPV